MKKQIASKRWLITYLIILVVLIAGAISGVGTVVYGINLKNGEALTAGIVILLMMLPAMGLILFWLNRRACFIWIEDGYLKSKGLLFGFKKNLRRNDVVAIGITPNGKKIYVISPTMQQYMQGDILFPNNEENAEALKSFWKADIYSQNECESCVKLKTVRGISKEEYLKAISYFQSRLESGEYELLSGTCDIDKIVGGDGECSDDWFNHTIKCKKCGTIFYCFYDDGDGRGNITKVSAYDYHRFIGSYYGR